MDALWQDVRYALRTLARSPGFTLVGVGVLALAIAVNTAIFSLVNALIFVKPHVPRAGELRYIYIELPERYADFTQLREYRELRAMHPALERAIGFGSDSTYLGEQAFQRTVPGERVTPDYFEVLEVPLQLGRPLDERDNRPDSPPVVVISDALWRSHFSSDPAILGKRLRLAPESRMYPNARDYTIVGVTAPGFRGIVNRFFASQFWAPHLPRVFDGIQYTEWRNQGTNRRELVDPVNRSPLSIAFRAPAGFRDAELEPVLEEATRRFSARRKAETPGNPRFYDEWSLAVTEHRRNRLPFNAAARIVPARMAIALMVAAAAVLLIAVANLAGMLAARGVTRRGEMAIRTTLGAGWGRLSRQLLVESLMVSAAGAAAGVAIARMLTTLLTAAIPNIATGAGVPVALDIPLDARVLAFTALTGMIAAILVTFGPARQALARDLLAGLSDGQASAAGRGSTRLRRWVVVPQVCASLVLVVVAATLIRSVLREEAAYRGYESHGVIVADFYVEPTRSRSPRDRAAIDAEYASMHRINAQLLERAGRMAGVEAAALSVQWNGVPLAMSGADIVDRDRFTADPPLIGTRRADVSVAYFDLLGIPLVDGRMFDAGDVATSAKVAIVDESLSWHLARGASPVGKFVAFFRQDQTAPPVWLEVVGVVGSVAMPLEEGARASTIYTPLSQARYPFASGLSARIGGGDRQALMRTLRQEMAAVDNRVTVRDVRPLDDAIGRLYFPRRISAAILGTAGLAGLLLACIGLYGVVSYSVEQRVREIGIRTALGAERRDIMRMILRDGARVIALGGILGGMLAFAAIKLTSATVVALPQADLVTLALAPLTLALAMLLATYIPARRAAAVDPMLALRRL